MAQKKILFITHDSSRSGAPMLLSYLLTWLKEKKSEWTIDTLTLQKGPLDKAFEEVSDNFDFYYPKYISRSQYYTKRFFHRKFDFEHFYIDQFYKKYGEKCYDIIYANTVVSLPMAIRLKNNGAKNPKLICNIHELSTVIDTTVANFSKIAEEVDLFIAGSKLVSENLSTRYGIHKEKIKIVYDFTDLSLLPAKTCKNPKSTFVIGALGAMNWRKGNDLFLLVAFSLKKKYPELNIKFEWMGAKPFMEQKIIENDLIKANLSSDYIEFKDQSVDYRKFFTRMDILLLTSREDPFPLVAIEAGAYGLPLITFENATGINEIIKKNQGGGYVVPYLDTDEMVEKIVFYYNNREEIKKDAAINTQNFKEFTVENSGSAILDIIESI